MKIFLYVWHFEVRDTEEYLYMKCTYSQNCRDSHKFRCIWVFCVGDGSYTLKGFAVVTGFSPKRNSSFESHDCHI